MTQYTRVYAATNTGGKSLRSRKSKFQGLAEGWRKLGLDPKQERVQYNIRRELRAVNAGLAAAN